MLLIQFLNQKSNNRIILFILLIFLCKNLNAQKSEFIYQKNAIIHFKKYGKGKKILIINGGPGMNCEGFEKIAQDISKLGYQTIIYDQRGTGKSKLLKIDANSLKIDLMIEDIETIRKHLKIKKWSIFGQSFGGILATIYAKKYENKIEKLIFSSSAGVNLNFLDGFSKRINNNLSKIELDSLYHYDQLLINDSNNKKNILKRAQFLASTYVFQKKYIQQLANRLIQADYTINTFIFNDLKKNNYNYENQFRNFTKPVIVFQGENDVISIETAKEIEKTFSGSKLILLKNCSHFPWLDQPNIFFESLEKFLM